MFLVCLSTGGVVPPGLWSQVLSRGRGIPLVLSLVLSEVLQGEGYPSQDRDTPSPPKGRTRIGVPPPRWGCTPVLCPVPGDTPCSVWGYAFPLATGHTAVHPLPSYRPNWGTTHPQKRRGTM